MARAEFKHIDREETMASFSPEEFDGPVKIAIEKLQEYAAIASKNGWYEPHIDVDYYYDDCTIYIKAKRPETDAEYESRWEAHKAHLDKKAARQKKAAEAAARKLAKTEAGQRALYEELKAKFG